MPRKKYWCPKGVSDGQLSVTGCDFYHEDCSHGYCQQDSFCVSDVPFSVTPALVCLADSDIVPVELTNTTGEELVLEPNAVICEIHQVTIADNVSACDAEFLE